jgi:hypothetical protein
MAEPETRAKVTRQEADGLNARYDGSPIKAVSETSSRSSAKNGRRTRPLLKSIEQ